MIGETLSHYRITGKLGEGGMGEVYLAEDTELDRQVAIKVLPSELSEDPERLERFKREAKAVAALNHPNIVTIYSIEESKGRRFLIMELVEGESLDRALPPGGLPLAKVFEIAVPLADALSAAHEKGIVHRDLKPANVMITRDGRVKVLDFGLAKLAAEAGQMPADADATQMAPSSANLTREGVVMGTAPYMSPEQLQGKTVDHRSDIFSLGVVLYEMVSGARPFRGENSAALVSSIMRDTPAPVFELRADLPRHLGRIIQHCLEKEPRERFQTSLDVRNELKSLQKEVESGTATSVSGTAAVPVAAPPMGFPTTASGPATTPAADTPSVPISAVAQLPVAEAPVAPPYVPPSGPEVTQAPESMAPVSTAPPSAPDSAMAAVSGPATAVPSGPALQAPAPGKGKLIGIGVAIVLVALVAGWRLGRGGEEESSSAATADKASESDTSGVADSIAATGEAPSIAVLPFADRSADGDQEYFADGLTEELINALARAGDLRVAGRTSSFQFKNTTESLETIGEQLNVTTILEGSVRKAGEQIRITAQLVNIEDGFQLWSETYDRSFDDIFEVQDEIASSVASALKVTLLGGDAVAEQSVSTDAYNLFLQAKYLLERSTRADNDEAIRILNRALELDPEYAAAWAELGLAFNRAAFVADSEDAREEAVDQGHDALERALELDPDLPEALSRMGWVLGAQELDFVAADAFTRRALEVAPNNPIVLGNASSMASVFGRVDEAIALQKKVLEIDPLDLTVYGNGAGTFLEAGRYEEALDYLTKLRSLSREYPFLYQGFGRVYLAQGRFNEALAEFEQEPDKSARLTSLALVHHAMGNKQSSDKTFEEFRVEFGAENPYRVAVIQAYRGEVDQAFSSLDRAYIVRDPGLSNIKMNWLLENIRSDPRWEPFLAKMGLAD